MKPLPVHNEKASVVKGYRKQTGSWGKTDSGLKTGRILK